MPTAQWCQVKYHHLPAFTPVLRTSRKERYNSMRGVARVHRNSNKQRYPTTLAPASVHGDRCRQYAMANLRMFANKQKFTT